MQTATQSTAVDDPNSPNASDENANEFQLELLVEGGGIVADDLAEYFTCLRADSKGALMILGRHNGDLVDRPVGCFGGALDQEAAMALANEVESVDWPGLAPPERGDITMSMLKLSYARGNRIIRRDFNARNVAFLVAIKPLMDHLTKLMRQLAMQPTRAVQVAAGVAGMGADGITLQMSLAHRGDGPAMIRDPRHAVKIAVEDAKMSHFMVAPVPEETPGTMQMPPMWQRVEIAPAPDDSELPEHLTMDKGTVLDVTSVPFMPTEAGEYMVQAIWWDYAAIKVPEPDSILPLVPESYTAERASMDKPYPVRGAAFSSYKRFVVP